MEKLKSCAGESLIETLVGLLIGSISLLMLASTMASSAKLIDQGETLMNDYTAAEQSLILQKDDGSSGTGTVKFEILKPGETDHPLCRVSAAGSFDSTNKTYAIKWYENDKAFPGGRVLSYKIG